MYEIEKEVLVSFIYYSEDMDKFLDKCPLRIWSKEAKLYLKVILELDSQKALNLTSFITKLEPRLKETTTFNDLLTFEPNPNYIYLVEAFLENFKLNKQKEIGQSLLNATQRGYLLDIYALHKDLDIQNNNYLSLTQWSEYYKQKPISPKYKTGILFFDNCLNGGLELSQLILISGDPEAGKTMFGLQVLEALSFKTKVAFFSFEFTIDSYLKRRNAQSPLLNSDNFLIINEGYDITEISQNIKNLVKMGVKFFLIDSQMRITTPKSEKRDEEQESNKFSTLARLCHSLEISIFLIIQTSKTDKDTPIGSKKGGHEASIIVRLERVKPEKGDVQQARNEFDDNKRLFLVKKNKQTGKHYKNLINFDTNSLRFYEEPLEKKDIEIIYFKE